MNPSFLAAAPGGAKFRRAAGFVTAIGGALTLAAATRADSTLSLSASPNLSVPDGNTSGTFSEIEVPAGTGFVTDVNLKLTIAGTGPGGGWNGDLFILLTHAGRASYLVNRPGRDSAGLWGYDDNGFSDLVFDDEAPGDAHVYRDTLGVSADLTLPVTGTVQPDGRGKDPMDVVDADPRTFLLDVFDNRPADGPWRLLLFDLSPGGTFSLVDWELQLNYSQSIVIPETGRGVALAGAMVAGLGAWRWRARHRGPGSDRS